MQYCANWIAHWQGTGLVLHNINLLDFRTESIENCGLCSKINFIKPPSAKSVSLFNPSLFLHRGKANMFWLSSSLATLNLKVPCCHLKVKTRPFWQICSIFEIGLPLAERLPEQLCWGGKEASEFKLIYDADNSYEISIIDVRDDLIDITSTIEWLQANYFNDNSFKSYLSILAIIRSH